MSTSSCHSLGRLAFLSLLCAVVISGGNTLAQGIRVEAVPGVPFGVGRIVIPMGEYIETETLDTHFMTISDAAGRVHYPALRYTQPLGMVRELLGMPTEGAPSQLHLHFLFTGSEPLELKLNVPEPRSVTVVPKGRRPAYNRLMRAWWVRYKAAARKQRQEGDYSPIVETYLTTMLSQRLGLADETPRFSQTDEAFSMLLGTEKIRLAMLQESTTGRVSRTEPMSFPVPNDIAWSNKAIPTPASSGKTTKGGKPANEEIEEIAQHVPHECFYIRFAQFPNYLWLKRLLEEYGGDLSRMVMLRGTDSRLNARVEDQLGLRESSLSRMLGPQVISDIAMIGRDTYLKEGAAIGVIFEAKNNLLARELANQRKKRVTELESEGAKLETIKIDGKDVSFASTADNQLRSFYVQDGKFHLVTNCHDIARRFLECGEGKGTLGNSAEFRYARSLIPLGEENTLFVYLSRRFFQGLMSPQYQIELARRLRSVTDNELLELATLAAVGEGYGNEPITMDRLIKLGFLGSRVDIRSDGSFSKIDNRRTVDSLRGARGTFLPIPDTPIEGITRTEAERFARTERFHRERWPEMDPVLVGLRRTARDDETERVEIQARMLPLNKEKYGIFTEFFGPPTTSRIKGPIDDIVSLQGFVDGGKMGINPHHLYFGVRDAAPKKDYSERRFLKSLQVMRTAPAYVAAWPKPGFLDSIGMNGRPIGDGYRKLLLGLFRLDALNGFSLLSFDQQILAEVAPMMGVEETKQPAQLHVHVGDIMNSKFGKWANDLDFQRAWETSMGNVHLLHVMTQQLRVPMPQAKKAVERAMNAELHCPLDGDYELVANPDGTQRWASSAWLDGKQKRRDEYVSPLMQWLRGLDASVTIADDRIVAEAVLDIKRAEKEKGGIQLPLFNFFSGGTKKNKVSKPTPAPKSAPKLTTKTQPESVRPAVADEVEVIAKENVLDEDAEELPPADPTPQ